MRRFDEIIDLAADLHGGQDALERMLSETRPLMPRGLAKIPDDRILAAMTRRVFSAGFSSNVIDAKWQSFESAFERFDPGRCAWMTEERCDELLKDKDIVRNGAKIKAVQQNGRFLMELAEKHGSAARFLTGWPDADYVGLLDFLKKNGSRLGGETGMHFLRSIGKPAFITTPDVVKPSFARKFSLKAPLEKAILRKYRWPSITGQNNPV